MDCKKLCQTCSIRVSVKKKATVNNIINPNNMNLSSHEPRISKSEITNRCKSKSCLGTGTNKWNG